MISTDNYFAILGLRRSFSAWDPPVDDIPFGQDACLNIFVQVFLGDPGYYLVAGSDSFAHLEVKLPKERNIAGLRLWY